MKFKNVIEGAKSTTIDMTKTSSGSFSERIVIPAGKYPCRLVEYVEYGKRVNTFNGEPKPPCLMVKLGFLFFYQNKPVVIRTYYTNISNHPKSKYKQMFDRINKEKGCEHLAELLGDTFLIDVEKIAGSGNKKDFNTFKIDNINVFFGIDYKTGAKIPVPEADEKYFKLFIWSNPTKECWDSLYIPGDNNYVQEEIKKAVDYEGSKLQELLEGSLPEPEEMLANNYREPDKEPELPIFDEDVFN